jgi:hypothetical protein
MSKFIGNITEGKLEDFFKDQKEALTILWQTLNNYGFSPDSTIEMLPYFSKILFSFSKFKKGDQVMLKSSPEIGKNHGWYSGKHYIVPGNRATVTKVSLDIGKDAEGELEYGFEYLIKFDNETFISTYNPDSDNEIEFKPVSTPHHYSFREDKLKPYDTWGIFTAFKWERSSKKYRIITEITNGNFYVDAEKIE